MTILKHIKPVKHTAIVIAFLITALWLLKSFEDSRFIPVWITNLIAPIPEAILEPLLSLWMFVISIFGIEMTVRARENKKYAADISDIQSSPAPIPYITSPSSLVKINNTRAHGAPNENFRIGREKLLKELFTNFVIGHNTQVLYGEDGMGKTRVAIEYAYMYEQESTGVYSDLIWWLRAKNKTVLEEDFLLLAKVLSLDTPSATKQYKLNSIFSWFKEHKYWLLIFDDASNEETIKDFLPLNETGNILITTTNPDWNEGHLVKPKLLKIDPLNPNDAKKFLIKRTGNRLSEEEATKLALDLEGYPLLLDLAGAYLSNGINEKKGLSFGKLTSSEIDVEKRFSSIINKLLGDLFQILKEQGTATSSIGFFYTVWVLGWFEAQMIPKYIFNVLIKSASLFDESYKSSKNLGDRLLSYVFSPVYKNSLITSHKILDILKKRSFITIDSEGEFININSRIQPFLSQLAVKYKEKGQEFRYSKLSLFNLNNFVNTLAEEFWFNEKKSETIEKCELLTPHVISVIEKMSAVDLKLVGLYKLAKKLSEFLIYKDYYEEAQKYASYAYELEKNIKRKASYDTLKQNMLPLLVNGKFDSLSKIIEESKTSKEYNLIYEKVLFGIKSLMQSQMQEAFNYFEDVVALLKIPQNKDFNIPVFYAYAGLAAISFDISKSEYYFEVAEGMITDKKTEDYSILLILKAAALKFQQNEDIDEMSNQAIELYGEAYSIIKEIKGEDNLLAIGILIDKGMTCLFDSWYEHEVIACCEIIERNMEFILKSLGRHHLFLGEYKIMKGQLSLWNDEREDAKRYFKEALEIHQKFSFDSRVDDIKDVLERLESED